MRKNLWIGAAVVVVLIAAIALYAVTHGSSTKAPTTASNTSSTSSTSKSGSPNQAVILQSKTDSTLGAYYADTSGNPLYTYGGDQQGVSNCTDQCIADWPAYVAFTTTNLPANVTIITRTDGTKQYAYKGLPLYTFDGDTSGTPSGDNVSNFHIAKP